jgi:circadian clock protein KaiC
MPGCIFAGSTSFYAMYTEAKDSTLCPTGIPGLDQILRGGLPKNRVYLVQGDPGVGKTTFALQFLLEGARRGETSLYITLSETRDEILAVAKSHGWSLEPLSIFELSAMEQQFALSAQNTMFHPADIELNRTTQALLDEVNRVKPVRVAIDSLSELRLLSESPLRYRRQMLAFKQFFAGKQSTVLFLDDRASAEGSDVQVQSIAHGVITLERRDVAYGKQRRSVKVEKLRGVSFLEGSHDYLIRTGGIEVFPRLVPSEHHKEYADESVSSGIHELDALVGGGLDRGTSTLVIGPAGTGKSSLAFQYAISAAQRGEKSIAYLFDENIRTLTKRSSALGLPLREHSESGCITLKQINPAEVAPGEFASDIQHAVMRDNVRFVIIDSLGGYLQAMPDEKFLNLQLYELLTFLRQQGVVSIITLAQHGLLSATESPIDVTYIADTVVLLRYFEASGRVKKAMSVIKKRSGSHEDTIREFTIGQGGMLVGDPITSFQGVLTGNPTFRGKPEEMMSGANE